MFTYFYAAAFSIKTYFYDKDFLSRVFDVFSQIRWLFLKAAYVTQAFSVILLTSAVTFEIRTIEIDCAISTKLKCYRLTKSILKSVCICAIHPVSRIVGNM